MNKTLASIVAASALALSPMSAEGRDVLFGGECSRAPRAVCLVPLLVDKGYVVAQRAERETSDLYTVKVQKGFTLGEIASYLSKASGKAVTVQELAKENNIANPNLISAGSQIHYTIQLSEVLSGVNPVKDKPKPVNPYFRSERGLF